MDSETGESYRDKETGEMPAVAKINLETGETEINHSMPEKPNRKTFRIPNNNPKKKSSPLLPTKSTHLPAKNAKFSMSDFSPCILFLLPTVICFHPILAAFISLIETALHVWAHKKNKRLANKEIWYQSPLHIFVREFCAACIDERASNKITRMQDKSNNKFLKYSSWYGHVI